MKKSGIIVLVAVLGALAACNTMEGAGQDLQRGGEKLERAADENKNPDNRY